MIGAYLENGVSAMVSKGMLLVQLKRAKQIQQGWTLEHDINEHSDGQLSTLASDYLFAACNKDSKVRQALQLMVTRDWGEGPRVSDDPVENLVNAAAVIIAEIDRILATRQ